jgi:mono/diheme cytochrome c family protein/uncharacterized membrane protein
MKRFVLGIGGVLIAFGCCPLAAPAADAQRDLAAEARAVFAAKCVACHGPDLEKPRGRFGYVLDLSRVANNREMVVPGSPDESELWELVRRGEMPPADSPTGPLNDVQKEVLRAWIAAGAPAGAPTATSTVPSSEPPHNDGARGGPPSSFANRTLGRLGAFHLLVVHFPIALLIAAAAREFWSLLQGDRTPTPAVRFCVLFGAVGAMAAAILGWLHAWNGHGAGMPAVLAAHRWTGTAAAVWALGSLALSEWEARRQVRSPWFRGWLFVGAGLAAAASHLGGVLEHGKQFLTGG